MRPLIRSSVSRPSAARSAAARSAVAPATAPVVEALEGRALRAAVYPTAAEQYAVELINRARANPSAEAARLGVALNENVPSNRTISTDPKQPLAINPDLTDAARRHSAWMIANSTFSHTGANGSSFSQRDQAAGYATPVGENLAINLASTAPDPASTVYSQHNDLFVDSKIPDRGHRTNMMNPNADEIGVGIATGNYNYPGYGTLPALTSAHDTGNSGAVYLTGVAYADSVNDDNFYSVGEGLSGVRITATRSDGASYSTKSWDSGGYSLAVPDGTYSVVGYGGGLGDETVRGTATVSGQNVKFDFIAGSGTKSGSGGSTNSGGTTSGTPTPTPTPSGFAYMKRRNLILNGTRHDDIIEATMSRDGRQVQVRVNRSTASFSVRMVARINVYAGDDNDRVTVNAGTIGSFIDGGVGKDTLVGGAGSDTIVGGGSNDKIYGNAGNDVLSGNNGNDFVNGGYDNDRLYGNVGDDTLVADVGNDRLWGGDGRDDCDGGSGRDYFYDLARGDRNDADRRDSVVRDDD